VVLGIVNSASFLLTMAICVFEESIIIFTLKNSGMRGKVVLGIASSASFLLTMANMCF